MKRIKAPLILLGLVAGLFLNNPLPSLSAPTPLPPEDERAAPPRTLNTPRTFPSFSSLEAWQEHAHEVRMQVLVSCGLWPMPEKPPLNYQIFDGIDREGYRVENVYLETRPGFYLAGNLYRPRGQGDGPFPGILNPHGHWSHGRLEDQELGSIAARCIQLARMGIVAFSYDMVGYADTHQAGPHRSFATNPTNLLWNISLMGLQTWNSIRALDFLESLPDVDGKRLACTGGSGGGTQTFMLGAVDDRLAAQAPMVMVSHTMQGGCLCENAPGLRVQHSNMEIAALPAPRSQLLVASTGDWTKTIMDIEGPAIAGIYQLFGQRDHLHYTIFDFPHNYNQTTREALYRWAAQTLLGQAYLQASSIKEIAYQKEPDEDLKVWINRPLPDNAVDASTLISQWIEEIKAQQQALIPKGKDKVTSARFKEILLPAWQHTLQLEFPVKKIITKAGPYKTSSRYSSKALDAGRPGQGDRLPVLLLEPLNNRRDTLVVLAHPAGRSAYLDSEERPSGIALKMLESGISVILFDAFLTGELADKEASDRRKPLENYFHVYNRTDLQERVQDLITMCALAKRQQPHATVVLCGQEQAGLWTLLAAPAADAVCADADAVDLTREEALLSNDLFSPGLRRIGAFAGGAALATPNPLLVHHLGPGFDQSLLERTYAQFPTRGNKKELRMNPARLGIPEVVAWIRGLE